jgi:hypothetical protein
MEKKKPSDDLLRELQALFTKHKWSGSAIGLTGSSAGDNNLDCVPPAKPTLVTIVHEDGTKESKMVCL